MNIYFFLRMVINSSGHLRIRGLSSSDEGLYVCVAANLAGSRESRPVRLKILSEFWNLFLFYMCGIAVCLLNIVQ